MESASIPSLKASVSQRVDVSPSASNSISIESRAMRKLPLLPGLVSQSPVRCQSQ